MNSSRSMRQNPSSSRLGQAPDQHSMRLVLQWLERLDGLNHRMHEEIQEIRSLFMELLDNYQLDVTMGDSGGYDSTVDSQTGLDGLNAIPPFISSHDRCFAPQPAAHRTLFGGIESPRDGTGPVRAGPFPRNSADYRPAARPSRTQLQHSMYGGASSAFHHDDPHVAESTLEPPPIQQCTTRLIAPWHVRSHL